MEVIIEQTAATAAALVVEHMIHHLRRKPDLVLGLCPEPAMAQVYAELVRRYKQENLDFSKMRIFLLSEFVDLPPEHDQAYRYVLNHRFLQHVNIPFDNINRLNGMAQDYEVECREYEAKIRKLGGLDLQVLAVGRNGNIGGNEAGDALYSRTGLHTLSRVSIVQHSVAFGDRSLVPHYMLSMGLASIMEARHCLALATGSEQAEMTAKFIEGPVTSMVPASVLQFHPSCVCILDQTAAVRLQNQDFYRWVQTRKPEWQRIGTSPRKG